MPERDGRWSTYEPTSDDYEIQEDWRNIMDGDGETVAEDVLGAHARQIVRAVNHFEAVLSACEGLLSAGCDCTLPHREASVDQCFHCRADLDLGQPHYTDCPYVAATALVEAIRNDGDPAGGI